MKPSLIPSTSWLAGSALLLAASAVSPWQAPGAAYTATNTAVLFSSATGWNPGQPVSAATTTIYLNRGGQPFSCTNDVAGAFLLNNLTRQVGGWNLGVLNGASFEFINNGSVMPVISNATSTAGITLNAPVRLDTNTIVDGGATAGQVTLSGVVSGPGGITKNSSLFTLTLSGANTFTGDTVVNAGTLSLNNKSGAPTINGKLTIGTSATAATCQTLASNQFASSSIVTFGGSAGVLTLTNNNNTIGGLASVGGLGTVQNNSANGTATLTVNVNGVDQTFSGILQDGSVTGVRSLNLVKTGANAQILTGANTYTGATTVQAGALTLSGSGSIANSSSVVVWAGATLNVLPSGFIVNAGSSLGGNGLVAGGSVEISTGGILAPGTNGACGTLTVPTLTLDNGCTNSFVFSPNANSMVNVTTAGGLTINGGAVNLYVTNTTSPFTSLGTYNLFQYAGSLGGAGVGALTVANPSPGLTYSFGVAGGYVQVTITAASGTAYWNVDASATWNSAADWTPAVIPNANGVTANFGGGGVTITAPRNVTLDGNQTVLNLNFNSANSFEIDPGTPASSTLTLDTSGAVPQINDLLGSHVVTAPIAVPAAGVSVNVSGGASIALDGAISGSGGLTNSGAGTLTLGGANSYSGGTTLNAGILNLNSATALGDGSGALTINGGLLDNTSGAAVTIANNNPENWDVNLLAFTGTTNLNLGTGPVAIASTGNFTLSVYSNTLTIGGPISNLTGTNVIKNGAGTLSLTGNSTVTNFVVSAGTLSLNAVGGALPSNANLVVNATLDVAQADTIANLVCNSGSTVSGVGTLTVTNQVHPNIAINTTNTISCSLAGPGSFLKTGQGTTILSAPNSYTGGTTISSLGVPANDFLVISGSGTLGSPSAPLSMVSTNATSPTLDLGGTSQSAGAVVLCGVLTNGTLSGASFSVTNGTAYAALADAGGSAALSMDAATGTYTLAGVNTFTGPTTLNGGGTLLVNGSLAAASAVTINAGTLGGNGTINGSVTETAAGTIAAGGTTNSVGTLTIGGDLTLNGGGSISVLITNASSLSQIVVAGSLNPSGTTTIVLPNAVPLTNGSYPLILVGGTLGGSAANFTVANLSPKTYTIAYQPGTPNTVVLQVSGPNALTWTGDGSANQWNTLSGGDWVAGNSPAVYSDGAYVFFNNSSSNQTVNISQPVSPAAVNVSGTKSYTFTGANGIGGSGSLSVLSSGTLTLATSNFYTGFTLISNGIVSIAADSNLGAAPASPTPSDLVLSGVTSNGTLSARANVTLNANRGITLGLATGPGVGSLDAQANQTLTYGGIIADNTGGPGTLIVNPLGTGTVTLSGPNTFTGGTTLTAGTLNLMNNQAAASGALTVGDGTSGLATLNVSAGSTVVASSIKIGRTTTSGSGATVNVSGLVTNNGALTVGRPGILNVNSGATWWQLGSVQVSGYGNVPATVNINAGATFNHPGSDAIIVEAANGTFSGVTAFNIYGTVISGAGFGANWYSLSSAGYPQVAIIGGTLALTAPVSDLFGAATAGGGVRITLTNNATIDTEANDSVVQTSVTGSGSLIKAGSGMLTLMLSNSYAGNTTVAGGTLALETATLASNSTVSVSSGCKLQLDFATTNTVAGLVLNGVSEPAGVYNSTSASPYLTGAGSLLVVPQGPTGPGYLTNSVNGNILSLSWPAGQGWRLQAQTNSPGHGLTTNWVDVTPGTANTTNITINPSLGSAFYRLIYP